MSTQNPPSDCSGVSSTIGNQSSVLGAHHDGSERPCTRHTEVDSLYDGSIESEPEPTATRNGAFRRSWYAVVNFFDRWWWWEVSAMIISFCSVVSLIGLLAYLSGIALESWKFLIQPNSLISVLVTIMKATLMVPLAGCFGQLKWHHYSKRPDSLARLQIFDEASRGPWGALMMMMQSPRGQTVLAYGLAVATLVALGLDAAAQQILSFPTRQVFVWSEEVQLSVADGIAALTGPPMDEDQKQIAADFMSYRPYTWDSTYVSQSLALNEAIIGRMQMPYFTCPESAAVCRFPEYKTLGLCSSIINKTQEALLCTDQNCTTQGMDLLASWDLDFNGDAYNHVIFNFEPIVNSGDWPGYNSTLARFEMVRMPFSTLTSNSNFTWYENEEFGNYNELGIEALEGSIYPCMQTYEAGNFSGSSVSPNRPTSTERLHSSRDPPPSDSLTFEWPLTESSTGKTYLVGDFASPGGLWEFAKHFNLFEFDIMIYSGGDSIFHESHYDENLSRIMHQSDIVQVLADIALASSNIFRTKPRETNTQARIIHGEALLSETYIRVRWQWTVVLILETLLAVLLLTATAIATGRSSGNVLLKNSALGLLFHGIDGWTSIDTKRAVTGQKIIRYSTKVKKRKTIDDSETTGLLDEIAETMHVRFCDDGGDGEGRRFVRVSRTDNNNNNNNAAAKKLALGADLGQA